MTDNNEIPELWARLQENRRQRLIAALPEACRTECSIARLVISHVMEEGTKSDQAYDRLGECSGAPYIIGECGSTKRVCSHPHSGETVDFREQIHNLRDYVQENSVK